ncbi:DDE-domain-containing protein [Zopfia rhizophila CBS 207.26]|uniref:DDE-domain-containing protein n=1 Tax=Zopfia rhizophila CBS 207.26 TaxID=1314779 RepID=A0A6A6E231_9PEZI|nr:DDE-domain-containing protein [Zopfia rhizophila CBS 207.26]
MPAHLSHILQPLDVGCFSPLKRAYRRQVEKLMRNWFNYITKLEFLPAFRDAFNESQIKLIMNKLGSLLSSLKDGYQQLMVLIRDRVAELEAANKADKSTKDPTTTSSSSKKGRGKARADGAKLTQRRCSNYSNYSGTRHNARTCEINEDSTIESSSNKNSTITNSTIK